MDTEKNYKHLFFDLDDTVTLSRSPIEPEMKEILTALPHDIIIVTGADGNQLERQVGDLSCIKMAQNGNHTKHQEKLLWANKLSQKQRENILTHIAQLEGVRD